MSARARWCMAAVLVMAAATPALAREVVRNGVPIDSLTPEGLTRSEVSAPAADGLPVRISYTDASGKVAVVMDVVVARDAAGARAALERARRGVSGVDSSAARSDIGDDAFGSGRIIGFTQDNVMIVVRRVLQEDVEDLAQAAQAAVQAAPTGTKVTPSSVTITNIGVATDSKRATQLPRIVRNLSTQGDILAARLVATGAGYARAKGPTSWSIVRTEAQGAIDFDLFVVDSSLRVTHP